mmetsp:Transcript_21327/g.43576  ORF Transcript_21327/g.43576 Transcript_21327/m.43576 type:complete len:737 (+) Transcript_21327:52-2262(+)
MTPLFSSSTISLLPTNLTNISSSRHRPPTLTAPREEGWTEVWGDTRTLDQKEDNIGEDDDGGSNEKVAGIKDYLPLPPRYITVLGDGCDFIGNAADERGNVNTSPASTIPSQLSNSSPSQINLKLTQHRVAWHEQIVLRMCRIPHVVENSGYNASESTGALPHLLDLQWEGEIYNTEISNTRALRRDIPVLVGRRHPGGLGSSFFREIMRSNEEYSWTPSRFSPSGSHIVDYLRLSQRGMENCVLFPEHFTLPESFEGSDGTRNNRNCFGADAMAYSGLLEKLNYILHALRYGNDPAWEGLYRNQCIAACLDPLGAARMFDQKQGYEGDETTKSNTSNVDSNAKKCKAAPFFSLWSWYQAYSERKLALYNLNTGCELALELFHCNDYRSSDLEENDKTHQHHPFASLIPSYGGVGGGDSGRVNVIRAMEYSDELYSLLEEKMAVPSEEEAKSDAHDDEKHFSKTYFLKTDKPTYLDALLFSHLAEALCDVHLILVLCKHSKLMCYFQWMYECYFGEEYEATTIAAGGARKGETVTPHHAVWITKNNVVNARNAFNQIPTWTTKLKSSPFPPFGTHPNDGKNDVTDDDDTMIHSIQLMQILAVHCRPNPSPSQETSLEETMREVARSRIATGKERGVLKRYHAPFGSRFYQWLMGREPKIWGSEDACDKKVDGGQCEERFKTGNSAKEGEGTDDCSGQKKVIEQLKREKRNQDELWLSGVIATIVAALVVSNHGKSG